MIFDTHAHLDDAAFDPDRAAILDSLGTAGIGKVINASANLAESEASVTMSSRYPFIYAAVGVHPDDCAGLTEEDVHAIGDMYLKNDKVAAIGEIGLDYHRGDVPRETQKKWFRRFMELAADLNAPVEIHSRDAAADTLDILKSFEGRVTGTLHCYSYSPEMAEICVKLGWRFGIGGVVTFKNGRKLQETVKALPQECILLETDSPYLSPEPFRGQRNEPANLKYVVRKIAGLRNESVEEVERYTYENACALFNIKAE